VQNWLKLLGSPNNTNGARRVVETRI